MSNSSRVTLGLVVALTVGAHASHAEAQPQAQGFAVERFYPSAPEGGWFVMDDLDLHGGLGAALELTSGYARNPLRLSDGSQRLAVVSDTAFVEIGAAVTYDRFRLYLDLTSPLAILGKSGTIGGYAFTAPPVDLGQSPDTLSDTRIGFDARIFGQPGGAFRLGAGAQLFVPGGARSDYDTDDTFRAMFRLLFAGDARGFTYAGHVGVHIRPLDDAPTPGSPRGHELLFGLAAGPTFPIGRAGTWRVVIGPEIWGATAFRTFFGEGGTAVEGLLSSRFEGPIADGLSLRVKLGSGIGSDQQFGAPDWRAVCGIEMSYPGQKP